jgi:hypothetical protein
MQSYADDGMNPVKGNGLTTAHASAIVVLSALAFLILVKRGFRGVSAGGVSIGVR